MIKLLRTTLIITTLLGASLAQAALDIRIDFSSLRGTPGGNWNLIETGVTPNALIDFNTGLNTGSTLSLVTMNTNQGFLENWTGGNLGGWMENSAGEDLLGANSASGQVVLNGLGSGPVQIEFVSAFFDNQVSGNYRIDGTNANRTQTGTSVNDPWQGGTDGRANYLIWDSVSPDGGSITIDLTNQSNVAGVSAMRITQVPEPATWSAILGLSALALVIARSRRRS